MDLARARIEVDAAHDAVTRQEEMARTGVGREVERIAAKHRLAESKAALAHAQKAVSRLGPNSGGMVTVTAPIAGTILRRMTTVGAQVEPGGDPLLEIGNPEALWVVAEVFCAGPPCMSASTPRSPASPPAARPRGLEGLARVRRRPGIVEGTSRASACSSTASGWSAELGRRRHPCKVRSRRDTSDCGGYT
ncbi:Barrel-sandwich domain of CusB or HlyD membrane-fusion [Nannocystis exedens]|uniref:Barrel-sandwich domain of CusB or HlyD membrane-fusion n=2 Tax=Nannocystis exedens TaxID=54 RepID=A0A1I2HP20_9BACT|nr:cobalt-zinc-cadmium resistance protein [Nannocystis exedens]SFF31894.1 Barrel-sandwich domain of CusB or HlyD membrane-fusion [Nannocystis exedens]